MRMSSVHKRLAIGPILCWALLVCAAGVSAQNGDGREGVYVDITSANIERLTNAVRITLSANGTIRGIIPWDFWISHIQQINGRWSLEPLDEMPLILANAKSQVGSFVNVATYPVSHILLTPTGEGNLGIGLRCAVVLYKPGGLVLLDTGDPMESLDWGPGDWRERGLLIMVDIKLAQDQKSIIVTVRSDQYTDTTTAEHRAPAEGDKRRLSIGQSGDALTLDAVNIPVSRVFEEIGRRSGRSIALSLAGEKWVTAYLPAMSADEMVKAICSCYELSWTEVGPGRYAIADARAVATETYLDGRTEMLPCRYIGPKDAINLLPNALLPYVHVNIPNNAVVVSGPQELVDKVRADLAVIDQPAKMIEVEATVVAVNREAAKAFEGEWWGGTYQSAGHLAGGNVEVGTGAAVVVNPDAANVDLAQGPLLIPRATPPGGWRTVLRSLSSDARARVLARPRTRVVNGHTGELFVGNTAYIIQERSRHSEGGLQPVQSGVTFRVTPVTGNGEDITVNTEVVASTSVASQGGEELAATSSRSVRGAVRIRNGESVVVAGLATVSEFGNTSGLPVLDREQLLARLFGLDAESEGFDDVVFILRARVVGTAPETGEAQPTDDDESTVLLGGDDSESGAVGAVGPPIGVRAGR